MTEPAGAALREFTQAVLELACRQGRMVTAVSDVAREQRTTNIAVRSQITPDSTDKAPLLGEASGRADTSCRRSPHDSL